MDKQTSQYRTKYMRLWWRQLYEEWGNAEWSPKHAKELAHITEKHAKKILAKSGYSEIFDLNEVSPNFPLIDILAKKNGETHGFLVTSMLGGRKVPKKLFKLCDYLHISKIFLILIKPDLTWHHIEEITRETKYYHGGYIFHRHLKKQKNLSLARLLA